MNDNQINGMFLPARLMLAMGDCTWSSTGKNWKRVFPVDEVVNPELYSMRLIQLVNSKWINEIDPEFVGVADGLAIPGNLVQERSLLIGELQGDSMIALDYRSSEDNPSVVFLNMESRWVLVTASFDEFWCLLIGDI